MESGAPPVAGKAKKRLFIGLLILSLLAGAALFVGIWYLAVTPVRSVFSRLVFWLLIGATAGVVLVVTLGIGGMVLTIWWSRRLLALEGSVRVAINLLFPLALLIGRLLGRDAAEIKQSFIAVNNQMVRSRRFCLSPAQLLLLLPHCLQWSLCPHKITIDINNCHRCGRCPVNDLIALREKYGVALGMATGGTLARRHVKQYRPRAIVAVACERDLTSGIQDANPIPVLGVANERPNGPCLDTQVALDKVEEAIRFFLGAGRPAAGGG